jgi:hypothetical protein
MNRYLTDCGKGRIVHMLVSVLPHININVLILIHIGICAYVQGEFQPKLESIFFFN